MKHDHISPEQFHQMFPNATKSAVAANALEWKLEGMAEGVADRITENVFGLPAEVVHHIGVIPAGVKPLKRRIRQDTKPLLNKTEKRCLEYLKRRFPGFRFYPQAMRFRLANGLWYKPDFIAYVQSGDPDRWMIAYEVKGPHAFRGGFENLKMAASVYPDIAWFLIWEDRPGSSQWLTQEVLQ